MPSELRRCGIYPCNQHSSITVALRNWKTQCATTWTRSAVRPATIRSQQVSTQTSRFCKDQSSRFWRASIRPWQHPSHCRMTSFINSSRSCARDFLIRKRMRTTSVSLFRVSCPAAGLLTFSSRCCKWLCADPLLPSAQGFSVPNSCEFRAKPI